MRQWKASRNKNREEEAEDSPTTLTGRMEKVLIQLRDLYLRYSGDLGSVHSSLLKKGWRETKTKGMFYNLSISKLWVIFCEPRVMDFYRADPGDTPDPVWAKKRGEDETRRVPRDRWEKILKKIRRDET